MRKARSMPFEEENAPPTDDMNITRADMAIVTLLPAKASLSQSENQQELRV
jgi:hypothetical protein